MKKYSQLGGKAGKPAYRTQATFRYRKYLATSKNKLMSTQHAKKFGPRPLQKGNKQK